MNGSGVTRSRRRGPQKPLLGGAWSSDGWELVRKEAGCLAVDFKVVGVFERAEHEAKPVTRVEGFAPKPLRGASVSEHVSESESESGQ